MTSRLPGWEFYAPGRLIYCPGCRHGIGVLGLGLIAHVRRHPGSGRADPTHALGYSQRCSHCRCQVEYRFELAAVPVRPRPGERAVA